jgi:hypothetical protein
LGTSKIGEGARGREPSGCLQIPCFDEDAEVGTKDLERMREYTIPKIIATTAEIPRPRDFLLAMKIDLTETALSAQPKS